MKSSIRAFLAVVCLVGGLTASAGHAAAQCTAGFSASATDLSVAFTDASSPDSGSTLVSWAWDFGDANTSNTPSPTHTYSAAGT